MQVSESSSEEVHPQNHMSVFTESRNWVSVGALHLHHLFNLRGSALRKINFILLCSLPLSYAYLLNKLYLLLWRPVHYENSFCLFLLYILGRMGGNWGASNLAPSGLPWVGRDCGSGPRGQRGSSLATNLLFHFNIHHSSVQPQSSPQGWYLCHPHIKERRGSSTRNIVASVYLN